MLFSMRCLMLLLAAASSVASAAGLATERVFGPETPIGQYKHPASITELRNGDVYLV